MAVATILTIVGGAVVNAVAFTGGNYLFSKLGKDDTTKKSATDKIKLPNS